MFKQKNMEYYWHLWGVRFSLKKYIFGPMRTDLSPRTVWKTRDLADMMWSELGETGQDKK